jgi:hypothetical protein
VSDILPTIPLPTIAQDLFCQRCGYNLRGLTGNRCPECGGSLDGVRSLVPQIPWMYRKEIGWFRAYWRTVWFVMVRQARFCDEMARPVSYSDCQSFRWVTLLSVALPSLFPPLGLYLTWKPQPFRFSNDFVSASYAAIAAGWPLVIPYLCWLLFLVAATGVPSYFFHPREVPVQQQNRAIALSYYSCGPLVFLTLPVLMYAAACLPERVTSEPLSMALGVLTVTLPIGAIAPWWFDLIHLARRLVPQRPQRAVYLAFGVPILWVLLAILILVVLPVIIGYVVVIVTSLRQ